MSPAARPAPPIPDSIIVRPGTDITDVWERFEVFEALHHNIRICNPMTTGELDEVIDALQLAAGQRIVDYACGSGETLIRSAERQPIRGIGIDLSPWMVMAAHEHAQRRVPGADLEWVLGEARDFRVDPAPDVALCIGAEWVWHDFGGTCRALAERVAPGGVVAIGAARLHHDADPNTVTAERGVVETIDDMAAALQQHGLTPNHRVDPDDAGWDTYLEDTAIAAAEWASGNPGERADRWVEEQADWQAARDRDRDIIGWSVWIAHKDKPSA